MAIYKTTSCSGCGVKWQFMERNPIDLIVGPPVIKCSSCNTFHKTGMLLPSQLSSSHLKSLKSSIKAKIVVVILKALFYLPLVLGLFLSPILLLNHWVKDGVKINWLVYILILIFCWGMSFQAAKVISETIRLLKDIQSRSPLEMIISSHSQMEVEYNKNGGYVESSDWYS